MGLKWSRSPAYTLGAELELQLCDRKSRDLTPAAPDIIAAVGADHPHIKPEIFQSMLEINTGICETAREVREDLVKALATVRSVQDPRIMLVSGGTHPFSEHRDALLYPSPRFEDLIKRHRWIARRLQIFGLHVHVGLHDGDQAIAIMNGIMHYLPHLLALSASSPYWAGEDTGLASCRTAVFDAMPTAGRPTTFDSWKSFERFYDAGIQSKAITALKDLWWDVRPHPDFGTLEIRICDAPSTIDETVALVAMVQALVRWLDVMRTAGEPLPPPASWLYRENKWRACRYGLDAELVVDDSGKTVRMRRSIEDLVRTLEPTAAELGSRRELSTILAMLERGTSAERQRVVFEQRGHFESIVDDLAETLNPARSTSDRPDDDRSWPAPASRPS